MAHFQVCLNTLSPRGSKENMTRERYTEVFEGNGELTKEEWDLGWHFCMTEWDGLLIGPGMPEFKHCCCQPTTFEEATEEANNAKP